jgi:RNA polymerase sigma-70 factor, ECF subfamily
MGNDLKGSADNLIGGETTRLLKRWSDGDQSAFEQLERHVHGDLHRLASRYLHGERPGHILQATMIVHDAYLQLIAMSQSEDEKSKIPSSNRGHFIGYVAGMMRNIIVDYARNAIAEKRGGGAKAISITDVEAGVDPKIVEMIMVHEALDQLGEHRPEWKSVVELHYFGGFNLEETAEILNVSTTTAGRYWEKAKKWLFTTLGCEEASSGAPSRPHG